MEVRQFHGGQVLAGGMWSSGTSHIDQTDGVGGAVTLWGAHGERGRGKWPGTAGTGGVPGRGRCHMALNRVRWVSRGHWSPESSRFMGSGGLIASKP